ncbi:MAG: GAF domain-containing protein [Scytonema sp. RU_4_4]|nr:GAF domain-containing protein [Scytonema sp. RU_4_4]
MSADHPSQQTNGRSLDNILSKQQSTSEDQQFLHSIYDAIEASIFVVDVTEDVNFRYVAFNPAHERWTGICSEYVRGKTPEQVFSPTNAAVMRRHYNDCVRYGKTISYEECLRFQGIPSWWLTTLTPQQDSHGRIYRLIGTSTNINEQKQAEEALRLQVEREHLLGAFAPCAAPCWSIALHIRQSLDLDTILKRTVTEVRQFLQTSRVLIYRFKPDWSGVMAVESVVAPWLSVLGTNIQDPCFTEKHIERYRRGRIQVIEDIYVSGLHPCHIDLLASFQVRANLVVPIVSEQQLWGLLIAQHCQEPRQWQQVEVELLKQLGMQVGIAVQHAQLHHQVQCLNTDLESKVQQRTTQLQQALKFEALVRRITEKIRDSLDERQILQTVTRELAQALNIDRCKIDFFDTHYTTATTAYEYTTKSVVCQGLTNGLQSFLSFIDNSLSDNLCNFSSQFQFSTQGSPR